MVPLSSFFLLRSLVTVTYHTDLTQLIRPFGCNCRSLEHTIIYRQGGGRVCTAKPEGAYADQG